MQTGSWCCLILTKLSVPGVQNYMLSTAIDTTSARGRRSHPQAVGGLLLLSTQAEADVGPLRPNRALRACSSDAVDHVFRLTQA